MNKDAVGQKTAFLNTLANPVLRGSTAPDGAGADAILYGTGQGLVADAGMLMGTGLLGGVGTLAGGLGGHVLGGSLMDSTGVGQRYRAALEREEDARAAARASARETKTASLAYSAGSADALAALGIEKEAFVHAIGTGLAAGARALAPHVGKAVQGIATAGRRLGTGLSQAGRAAQPHLQQAGQQAKTMATNAYNTAKPVVQNAFNKVKGFAGSGGGVGDAVMNSGVSGVMDAAKQPRMY